MKSATFWDIVSANMGLSLEMFSRFGAMTIAAQNGNPLSSHRARQR